MGADTSHYDTITNEDGYDALKPRSSQQADCFSPVAPHEFTSIPFPVKALKILVHDLRSGGESAAIGGQGEQFDVDSDDDVSFHVIMVSPHKSNVMWLGRGMD